MGLFAVARAFLVPYTSVPGLAIKNHYQNDITHQSDQSEIFCSVNRRLAHTTLQLDLPWTVCGHGPDRFRAVLLVSLHLS